jgi:hypothetical protein
MYPMGTKDSCGRIWISTILNVIIKNSIMGLTTMKTNYFCKFPLNASR